MNNQPLNMPAQASAKITRIVSAPRELVFELWTNPKHLAQWWGPKGFSNPQCEADARPGGKLKITMKGPDGREYPTEGIFHAVQPYERLVFTIHPVTGSDGPPFIVTNTVEFEDLGGRTAITVTAEARDIRPEGEQQVGGMKMGWIQSLERLAELSGQAESPRELAITRVFNAPRELVFKAWTEPEHLSQWWGPNGFTSTIETMNAVTGGDWKLTMHGPDGTDYPNHSTYLSVVAPELIVYEHFSTPRFVATVSLEALGDRTRLTMRMLFDTPESRDSVVQKFGAREGQKQTLSRLESYLEKI